VKMRASLRFGVILGGSLVVLLAWMASAGAEAPDDVGLFDPNQGQWHIGGTSFYFGNPNDVPIVGDWDCDGDETPGLYRQSDGFVYLRNSNTQGNANIRFFFGNPGDIPIAGDFNNNGCDTVSLYRPSTGQVFIINQLGANNGGLGAADFDYYFGNPGDKPFVGDFNANGTDTIGLHRESTGLVYFRNSHTQGVADVDFTYGNPGDRFVGGDWNADATDTPGIFRPADTRFFLRNANTAGNADEAFFAGESTWLPVAGDFGLPRTLLAALSDEEVPAGSGDPDGTGLAVVTFDRSVPEVCFDMSHMNIDAISAAHIHTGALGTAGGVFVSFDVPTNGLAGCVAVGLDKIDPILISPGDYYVNLHNAAFPAGAIRGQLGREAELMAGLSDEEVPAGSGDPDGTGLAVVTFSHIGNPTGSVCFDMSHMNIDAISAAHIHTGALGTAGGVLISFDVPTNGLSGCVNADVDAINDILTDPAGFYVNLHNAAFPAGAIRGQLGRTVELMAGLSDEEVPAGSGDTDGTGLAVVDFSREGEVCFDITASNVDTITAAHIHTGALGTAGGVLISFDVPTNGLSGCVAASQAAIDDVLADPAGFYVNLHNAPFPAGAIRGQLGV